MQACQFGCLKVVEPLLGHGAIDLTLLDNAGRSALTCARFRSDADAKAITALLEARGAT